MVSILPRRMRRRLQENPLLVLVVAGGVLWTALFALQIHVYFVMKDELRYVKQAQAIGDRLFLLLPHAPQFETWSELQPLLMAPIWGIFRTPTAYQLTHLLNSLVMTSAAIPAYLLARRVLDHRSWAVLAALLSISIPWMVMTGVMMTEVAAYPAFLWAMLAFHRAMARPSPRSDLLAVIAFGVLFLARTEFTVIAPVLPLVILVQELRFGIVPAAPRSARLTETRAALKRHWVLLAACVVLVFVVAITGRGVLGNALNDRTSHLIRPGTFPAAGEMLAYIVIGVAALPLVLAAAWALTLIRPAGPEEHAFALLAVTTATVLTVLIGGTYSVLNTFGVNDRYLFYIAPLFFIGMLACLRERRSASALILLAGLGTAWIIHRSKLEEVGPTFVSASAAWHKVLFGRASQLGSAIGRPALTPQEALATATVVASILIAVARRFARAHRTVAITVAAGVLVWCLVETQYTMNKLAALQPAASYADGRDWVDSALPYGQKAGIILAGLGDPASATAVWWDLDFWNRKVDLPYYVAGGDSYAGQVFSQPFTIDDKTGRISGTGDHRYFVQGVSDRRFGLRDARVIKSRNQLNLLRVPSAPPSIGWQLAASDESGRIAPGSTAVLRLFGDGVSQLARVTLTLSTPFHAPNAYDYRVAGGLARVGGRIRPDTPVHPQVEVRLPAYGYAELRIAARGPVGTAPTSSGVQFFDATVRPALAGA